LTGATVGAGVGYLGAQGINQLTPGNFDLDPGLIAAMAGNVGVQSSAIIVQGLANNTISGSILNRLQM
jgi:hypothetical protein